MSGRSHSRSGGSGGSGGGDPQSTVVPAPMASNLGKRQRSQRRSASGQHQSSTAGGSAERPSKRKKLGPGGVGGGGSAASGAAAMGPPSGSQPVITKTVEVPPRALSGLVGPGGSTLKELEQNSGADISIPKRDEQVGQERKVVSLTGTPQAVYKAQLRVLKKTLEFLITQGGGMDDLSRDNLYVQVPTNRIKQIIGRSGSTIKEIQKESQCRLQFLNKPDEGQQQQNGNGHMREFTECVVLGNFVQHQICLAMMNELVGGEPLRASFDSEMQRMHGFHDNVVASTPTSQFEASMSNPYGSHASDSGSAEFRGMQESPSWLDTPLLTMPSPMAFGGGIPSGLGNMNPNNPQLLDDEDDENDGRGAPPPYQHQGYEQQQKSYTQDHKQQQQPPQHYAEPVYHRARNYEQHLQQLTPHAPVQPYAHPQQQQQQQQQQQHQQMYERQQAYDAPFSQQQQPPPPRARSSVPPVPQYSDASYSHGLGSASSAATSMPTSSGPPVPAALQGSAHPRYDHPQQQQQQQQPLPAPTYEHHRRYEQPHYEIPPPPQATHAPQQYDHPPVTGYDAFQPQQQQAAPTSGSGSTVPPSHSQLLPAPYSGPPPSSGTPHLHPGVGPHAVLSHHPHHPHQLVYPQQGPAAAAASEGYPARPPGQHQYPPVYQHPHAPQTQQQQQPPPSSLQALPPPAVHGHLQPSFQPQQQKAPPSPQTTPAAGTGLPPSPGLRRTTTPTSGGSRQRSRSNSISGPTGGPSLEQRLAEIAPEALPNENMELQLVVAASLVSGLIGKQGVGIRSMEEQSQASISIPRNISDQPELAVSISGSEPACLRAAFLVGESLQPFLPENRKEDLKMLVPLNRTRFVIGKQGTTIKRIQAAAGARVTVPDRDSLGAGGNKQEVADFGDQLPVRLLGGMRECTDAILLVHLAVQRSHRLASICTAREQQQLQQQQQATETSSDHHQLQQQPQQLVSDSPQLRGKLPSPTLSGHNSGHNDLSATAAPPAMNLDSQTGSQQQQQQEQHERRHHPQPPSPQQQQQPQQAHGSRHSRSPPIVSRRVSSGPSSGHRRPHREQQGPPSTPESSSRRRHGSHSAEHGSGGGGAPSSRRSRTLSSDEDEDRRSRRLQQQQQQQPRDSPELKPCPSPPSSSSSSLGRPKRSRR